MPILFLLAALAAASDIRDNAAWMRNIIGNTFAVPDSLLSDSGVCVKPAQDDPLHQLTQHAILQVLHNKNGVQPRTVSDSTGTCRQLLEFRILTMKTRLQTKGKWGILGRRFLQRSAEYELLLNLRTVPEGILVWTGSASGSKSQELPWGEQTRIRNDHYPELNAKQERSGSGIWLDTMILLGSAICLIYFLYR